MIEGPYSADTINDLITAGKIKSMTIEATVIRANGDIEPQGIISGWHKNILKNIALKAKIKFHRARVNMKRLFNG